MAAMETFTRTGRISAGSGRSRHATGEVGELSTSAHDPVAVSGPGPAGWISDVTEMVREVLLDYGEWTGPIAPNARLDADLGMQSVELSALQSRLEQRWGAGADLEPLLRTLDLSGLAELSVAAVAGWLATRPAGTGGAGR